MPMHTVDFRHFPLRDGDRILDLGCGEGRHAISACTEAAITSVGVDLSSTDLATAADRFGEFNDLRHPDSDLHLAIADGTVLPFADSSFDKVICSEVLEHVPEYRRILMEIDRVLKPGGIFAVSVPRFLPEWVCWKLSDAYHEVEGGHIRIFRGGELQEAIEAHGYQRYRKHFAHALHVPYWWLKCLFWNRETEPSIVRAYHRFLVWDLMAQPLSTRILERLLDPLMGKSVVMYFLKPVSAGS